jgi:hypothetical protein
MKTPVRNFSAAVILGALFLAGTPQLALAQDGDCPSNYRLEVVGLRPGQDIRADRLGSVLRDRLFVQWDEMCSKDDRLLVQVIDRDDEVIGSWGSERLIPTLDAKDKCCEVPANELIPDRSLFRGDTFGSEHTFIMGRVIAGGDGGGVPRECEDATHVLVLGVSDDSRFARGAPLLDICMSWRP